MTTQNNATLSKLSDTGKTVDGAANDIRGRKVKDEDGKDVGKVHDLLIDDSEGKVRFMLIEHGGLLGIGETKSFIPVDAITESPRTRSSSTTRANMSPQHRATNLP